MNGFSYYIANDLDTKSEMLLDYLQILSDFHMFPHKT